jgi:hypothetical protein
VNLNLGGGLFADPGTIDLAAHNTPIVADLNGDGIPDVTIVDARSHCSRTAMVNSRPWVRYRPARGRRSSCRPT